MRPALQLAVGVAVTIAAAGCSLLVSFDDPPPLGTGSSSGFDSSSSSSGSTNSSSSSSGSVTSSSSSSSSTSSSSSSSSSSGSTLPTGCVTAGIDFTQIHCDSKPYTLPNCADETGLNPNKTLDQNNDLVDCTAQSTALCVTHCANGCVALPNGFADACDGCAGKANGNYCGADVGWPTVDAHLAIACANGNYVPASRVDCGADGCSKANCTAPTDDPSVCCN